MNPGDEEVPYRSPATAPSPDVATDNDDEDFSTIVEVKKILDQSMAGLYKDFNAFELLKGADVEKVKDDLFNQVVGKQVAYDLLVPIQSMIDSAVESVMEKRKG